MLGSSAQARIGERLAELTKRFGSNFSVQGAEETHNLTYRFRLKDYSVDVGLAREGSELVAQTEVYYSQKPLQANGEAPVAIVRGIMEVTAPKVRWREKAAVAPATGDFVTQDSAFEVKVCPPIAAPPRTTFMVVATRGTATEATSPTNQVVTEAGPTPSTSETPATLGVADGSTNVPAAQPTPVFRIHINSTFVQALKDKAKKELVQQLGNCFAERDGAWFYKAVLPGIFGEVDGWLVIGFAGGKAKRFSAVTTGPPDSTFIKLTLQNTPGARFVPHYVPSNLTGQNWHDEALFYDAWTNQQDEQEYWFTVDTTSPAERYAERPSR